MSDLRQLLEDVAAGRLSPEDAARRLDQGDAPDEQPEPQARADALEAQAAALEGEAQALRSTDVDDEAAEELAEKLEERAEALEEEAEALREEAEELKELHEETDELRRRAAKIGRRVRVKVDKGGHSRTFDVGSLKETLRPALDSLRESLASIGPMIEESFREGGDVRLRRVRMSDGPSATAVVQEVIDGAEGLPIVVESDAGSVEVRATDASTVSVEAEKHAPLDSELESMDVWVRKDADAIRIGYRCRERPIVNRWVVFRIDAPASAALDIETGAGTVTAEGFRNGAKLRTGGGSVRVSRMAGDLEVRTGGGQVRAEELEGRLDVRTAGGSIDVRRVSLRGPSVVRSSGGQIHVEDVTGESLEATTSGGGIEVSGIITGACKLHTSGGSIRATRIEGPLDARTSAGSVTVEGRLSGESTIRTSAGSIDVRLPDDVRLKIRARGHNASNDFGLPVQRGTIDDVIGDGADGSLEASASAGSVSIRRL